MTTAEDDIAFGPENLMEAPAQIRATVTEMLETVGLPDMARRAPGKMSGGEKQRLAIGGVLAMQPQILVFDEPASGLDKDGRARFTDIVKQLKAAGHTVLIVEHDFEFLDFADRWVLMKDGGILSDAAPDAVPATLLERDLWL
jgi:energy-coupling factor transporter ATP-binding protein EcfA2